MGKYLTAYELADLLNLSVETIWRYTRENKIPVIKLGKKQYRYKKEEVLAALAAGGDLVQEEQVPPLSQAASRRTTIAFDVGVLLRSATLSSGTSTLVSGK